TAHWKIVDGTIKKIANGKVPRVPDGRPLNGGDLMTVETFGDFELSWEWKVTPGANSGVKYNVSEALSVGQGGQLTPAAVAQGSARTDSALAASKYHSSPGFAERRKGHIVLQDHGDEVYFRSIKVRVL